MIAEHIHAAIGILVAYRTIVIKNSIKQSVALALFIYRQPKEFDTLVGTGQVIVEFSVAGATRFTCGYAHRQIGQLEKSTEDLKKSLEFEPNNINTTNLWIENLIRLEETNEALSVCDSLIKEYPKYTEGYILRAQIQLQKNDTLQAIANLDTAILYNNKADLAYAMRGMIRYEIGQNEPGLSDLDQAISINSYRSDYYGNRAIIRMKMNNLRGAMSDFDTAIDIDNKNALSYFNRGLLRANVGDDNRAIDDFSTCLALDPNNYNAYMQRAILSTQVGDYKGAINDYTIMEVGYFEDFFKWSWRLFDTFEKDIDKLPQETSLQRSYLSYIKAGGKSGRGYGIFKYPPKA